MIQCNVKKGQVGVNETLKDYFVPERVDIGSGHHETSLTIVVSYACAVVEASRRATVELFDRFRRSHGY